VISSGLPTTPSECPINALLILTIDCRTLLPRCGEANRISFVMLDNVKDSGAHRYQNQWQSYRERRNWLGVLLCVEFLAFIPSVVFMETIVRRQFSADRMAFPAASLLFGAVYLFTASRLRSFPCPRCGKNFFGGFFATPRTVLGRNCANCGLRKYDGE
jgi:hypothetical protein